MKPERIRRRAGGRSRSTEREIAAARACRGRATRLRAVKSCRAPRVLVTDRNSSPDKGPTGSRSQRRTAWPRDGYTRSNSPARALTRRRAVEASGRTRILATTAATHPNRSRAIVDPSRTFSSCRLSVPSAEVTSVLISPTSSAERSGWKARRSIEPRSRSIEYVTSISTCQPSWASISAKPPSSAACPASSTFSSSPPRQRTPTSTSASSAPRIRSSVSMDNRRQRPVSTSDTACWLTPARRARSIWRKPRRRRSVRTILPIRTGCTDRSWPSALTWRSAADHLAIR
jgi:hypothetical protein